VGGENCSVQPPIQISEFTDQGSRVLQQQKSNLRGQTKSNTVNLERIAPALDFALPPCLSNSAREQVDYSFETIEYPGDSFTQLLGINNGGIIAGYRGVNANKGFIYDLSTKTFTDENFPGAA
jgi:hypothetical protein